MRGGEERKAGHSHRVSQGGADLGEGRGRRVQACRQGHVLGVLGTDCRSLGASWRCRGEGRWRVDTRYSSSRFGEHLSPSQVASWAAGGRAQEGRGDSISHWCFWKVTAAGVCYKVFLDAS